MTHQSPLPAGPGGADPGRQIAQLREVLRLVETIAGEPDPGVGAADDLLEEGARVSDDYDRALPIVQRRFDALAEETAAWAAAGVEALLAAARTGAPRAAAARLAAQLGGALGELKTLIR